MKIPIIATSLVKFGDLWEKSLGDLMKEAGELALQNAKLKPDMIDSLHIANAFSQEMLSALAYEKLGISNSVSVNAADASGAVAIKEASNSILSGQSNIAMVLGVEKMTDFKSNDVLAWSSKLLGNEEYFTGATVQSQFAMITRKYLNDFGLKAEDLWFVPSKNHQNGIGNEYAQFQNAITVDDVLKSAVISTPLNVLDCSPITDGAAALLLVSEKLAKSAGSAVKVVASGQASDSLALHDRSSLTEMLSTKLASKKAFEQAGLAPKDINFAEVHDCFSINEIVAIEALGFCKKGDGGKAVERGEIALTGAIPINTTGGLKAIGHPVGATGVRQLVDITKQLRGDSHNQLKGVKYGLNLNIGGSGATAVVNILGVE